MKITLNLPDKTLPELEKLMEETGARDLHELFQRAIGFYLYLFRLTRSGLSLAVLNQEYLVEGRLINHKLFTELFRGNSPESDPPGKQEN